MSPDTSWLKPIETGLGWLFYPVVAGLLLGGVDDLILDLIWLITSIRARRSRQREPTSNELRAFPQKRIAIFVPCWHESAVIGRMIEHNASAIEYRNYDFFAGAYPNDADTLAAIGELESRFPNVHLAVCPHDGPTSKADCLNWVYQRMLLFEEDHGVHFDVVMTHDAEDLIHSESLLAVNFHMGDYDMVQVPVLALPTPLWEVTHGVYCDEFSEFQIKDMRVRGLMGSFIPSNGVGTGYSRAALEKLALSESNRIFEPGSLTEDYENGLRLHRLGCRQLFLPLIRRSGGFVATREFFPSTRTTAIKQRTRWVTGIALQTWERHGWRGRLSTVYWFWRDRKGLVGNPLSLAANLVFAAGLITLAYARSIGHPWALEGLGLPPAVLTCTLSLGLLQIGIRTAAVGYVYGWVFALGVPVRVVFANYINGAAACKAIQRYAKARLRHEPLVWVKTEHSYPSRTALSTHKRKLGEILVGSGYISSQQLEIALAGQPADVRIGEYLVRLGHITESELYEALSLQQGVPVTRIMPSQVVPKAARTLPRAVVNRLKVLPFRVASGALFLATPEIPSDELGNALRSFTRMDLRFHLVTQANFDELTATLL